MEHGVSVSAPNEFNDLPLLHGEPLPTDLVEALPERHFGWSASAWMTNARCIWVSSKPSCWTKPWCSRGNVAAAARLLGLSRAQFAYRHRRARRDLD